MKKLIFVLAAVSFLTVKTSQAQKQIKEGKAEYVLTYEGVDEQYAAYMPKGSTVYFKENKTRTEMLLGMGMTQIIIHDAAKKETIMLQDMMGKKSAIKMDADKEDKDATPKVVNSTETKTIAGYKCTKATVTDEEGTATDVWFTKDIISNKEDGQFKGIDGFVMEANINLSKQGIEGTMMMTVKNVSTDKVADKLFEVPADYKLMTQEEYKKMMTGGGSDE